VRAEVGQAASVVVVQFSPAFKRSGVQEKTKKKKKKKKKMKRRKEKK